MYGAIIGDIVGSPYEFSRNKRKDFSPLFHPKCGFTDDTIMTVAVADSLMHEIPPAEAMRDWGRKVLPTESLGGYGAGFIRWLAAPQVMPPYNSYGNGSAMRVSPVAWLFDDLETALEVARLVTVVSHSHPEAVKGAQAVVLAILMANAKSTPEEIRGAIQERFQYDLGHDVDTARERHEYNETCQGCVPDAVVCALEATSYEDAIRNAISLGGDADTLAAITGSIAEALYGIPQELIDSARTHLRPELLAIIDEFYSRVSVSAQQSDEDEFIDHMNLSGSYSRLLRSKGKI
jgi:ADP-ribosylglycohydrolase